MNSSSNQKYPRGLASIPLPPVKKSVNPKREQEPEEYEEYEEYQESIDDWNDQDDTSNPSQIDHSLPFYIEYAKPELWSIKKREAKVKERYELDHKLISKLTKKRRDLVIHQDRIIQRQGPIPNLLSKEYHETCKFDRMESKTILPLPSFLHSSGDLVSDSQQEILKRGFRRKCEYIYFTTHSHNSIVF